MVLSNYKINALQRQNREAKLLTPLCRIPPAVIII